MRRRRTPAVEGDEGAIEMKGDLLTTVKAVLIRKLNDLQVLLRED